MTAAWLLSPILLPLVAAGLAPSLRRGREWLAGVTPLGALSLGLLGSEGVVARFEWLVLGIDLRVDTVGRLLLVMAALVWCAAGISARSLVRDHTDLAVLFQLTMAGNLGLVVADDVVTFYVLFAVMTFAAYGLVVHERTPFAMRAGRVYIALAVVGEVALLSGLVLAVGAAQGASGFVEVRAALDGASYGGVTVGLLVVGFAVKAGIMPVHLWLPLAHPAAPVPASAVLSGAMIKAGLLGWLRVLPIGEIALPGWSQTLIVVGITTAFLAVAVGLPQRDAKTVLAYSSVSQMGLMTVTVGVALAVPGSGALAATAAALQALHHGLAKGALFLGVGVLRNVAARHRGPVLVGMGFAAVSLAGAPLTSGWVAKSASKTAIDTLPGATAGTITLLVSLSSVATTILMVRLFPLLPRAEPHTATARWLLWPWAGLLVGVAAGAWTVPVLLGQGGLLPSLGPGGVWDGTWPVLLGLAAVGVWLAVDRRLGAWRPQLPPGDVVVAVEAVGSPLRAVGRWVFGVFQTLDDQRRYLQWAAHLLVRPGGIVDRAEEWMTRWRTAGVLFVLVSSALLVAFVGAAGR